MLLQNSLAAPADLLEEASLYGSNKPATDSLNTWKVPVGRVWRDLSEYLIS